MNFNKLMLATVIALSSVSMAQAAGQGSGKVNFKGEIINAPCSLDADSVDQTVDFDQIASKKLENKGKTLSKNFTIKLKDCDIETGKTVTVAFTGQPDANDTNLLGIAGTASGAGIQLLESNGSTKIKLDGTPTSETYLQNNDNILNFAAYVQGSSLDPLKPVVPGDFTAVTNFTLAYQ